MSLSHSVDHNMVLRSMFREIMRGLRKISHQAPVLQKEDLCSSSFDAEVKKAAIDRIQYREYLLSEIRHTVFQKFSSTPRNFKDHVWHSRLFDGHNLVEKMSAICEHPGSPSSWKELVELVLEERNSQLRKSKWTLEYKANKKVIDEGHLKEMHPLNAKRQLSRQKRGTPEVDCTTDKGFKKCLAESEANASWVVRNYLKKLQVTDKIPNPYKLPYVSDSMHQQALQLPKVVNLLPGSTRDTVLESAYNMDYVESIIKPEIEYLLNKKHYLNKYQDIVNKKGPYKVQIKSTNAGIMPVRFIRSPVKDTVRMKNIAIDVKRSTRSIRKQFIWKLDSSQAENICERKIGDGFAVRGSKGYSVDEVMYPKSYHKDIASKEAAWEFLIKLEEFKAKYGDKVLQEEKLRSQLGKVRQVIVQSWLSPLDTASEAIDQEVKSYFNKYNVTENSSIWKRRAALQMRMDKNYQRTSKKLAKLIKLLERDGVFLHSDLFYRSRGFEWVNGNQIPEKQRILSGKSLGDYLEEVGLKGYKMGYEFKRRLNIC
ncbi:hypothetical protein JCM33374_g5788 [Metschnikowia sp. JCM 33374]|nr:hypothetical protein JCM33374_g5788 [Metschnikowia sp. JCM 33374]